MRGLLAVFFACAFAVSPGRAAAAVAGGVTIAGGSTMVVLNVASLAKLPVVTVAISFRTDHGAVRGSFTGPLLWSVLTAGHETGGSAAREIVTVTGADGYRAIIAMGEIAPSLEDKQVVLALAMDGKPLTQPLVVLPGDRYGPRSVRDVVRIMVSAP